jgi:hypothetical protein
MHDRVFVTHDAECLTAFYTDDATILPPTAPVTPGHKATSEFWQFRDKRKAASAAALCDALVHLLRSVPAEMSGGLTDDVTARIREQISESFTMNLDAA